MTAPPTHPAVWTGRYAAGVGPAEAPEGGVDERHDRVEVAPGYRSEHQDDGEESGRGGSRVLEQLDPDATWRKPLRSYAGADHKRGEKRAAKKFGDEPTPERGLSHTTPRCRDRMMISNTNEPRSGQA